MGIMQKYRPADEDPRYCYDFVGTKSADARRLSKGEQDELIRIFGASAMLIDVFESKAFETRLKSVKRGQARLRTAFTMIKHVAEEIINSAPRDQAVHMCRNLSQTCYMTYVGKYPPLSKYKDEGRWMSFEELNIIASISREMCKSCMVDDRKKQEKCPVNKFMRLMPIDNPQADKGGCAGWMETLGSAE